MAALTVVEDLDVLKDASFGLFSGFITVMMDPFGFQRMKETLNYGIIVAVAFSAHAAAHFV
jgi:hypothetical protein